MTDAQSTSQAVREHSQLWRVGQASHTAKPHVGELGGPMAQEGMDMSIKGSERRAGNNNPVSRHRHYYYPHFTDGALEELRGLDPLPKAIR